MMRLFPEGLPLEDLWVIKHGLAEYRLLKQLGFRLPNPILCYYDWAAGTPFTVQRVTGSLLTSEPRAYVLNDMGTGKTKITLWSWDYLRSNNYCGKLLVTCKLSNTKVTWANECFATIPHRKVAVLTGTKKARLAKLADPEIEIFIVNHDGLKVLKDELFKRTDIDVFAIDELATFRNPNDRSKLVLKLAEKMRWVWGLTGSPMPNEPTDVWMQCRIVTPHTVPKYRSHARDMLMLKKSEYLWVPRDGAVDKAFSWMQPAVRFSLDDVVELPEIVERYIDVPPSDQQSHVYGKLANEFTTMVGNEQINAVNAGAAMNKLLQVSGGYVYASSTKTTIELEAIPRKETLRDLIQSATKKVLVFCAFRHMAEGLAKYLTEEDIEVAMIHGGVSDGQRNQVFNDFQDTPKYKAIVAHPGCMSHGLTLTAADTIIWYCPITSYETYEQANARIRRVGQTHRQQIIHLQGASVERKIYALLRRKAKVQDMLLSLFEAATDQVEETTTLKGATNVVHTGDQRDQAQAE